MLRGLLELKPRVRVDCIRAMHHQTTMLSFIFGYGERRVKDTVEYVLGVAGVRLTGDVGIS